MWNTLKTIVLLGALSALVAAVGAAFGPTAAWVGLALALAMNVGAYLWSDRLVLRMHGARALAPHEVPSLHRALRELAAAARIPVPGLYLIDDAQPNAFATGRGPSRSAVAVTSGLLQLLDARELRGVLAHELAHVRNRDVLLSTVAATLVAALSWAANAFSFATLLGGSSQGDGEEGGGAGGGLLFALVAPFAGTLVQLGISRAREYAADETGARLCGDPEALATALLVLEHGAARVAPATAQPATASLFIVNPFAGAGGILRLFATHPPTEERVRRLRALARLPGFRRGFDVVGVTG